MQNREIMPEFLQENCTPSKLAGAVLLLLTKEDVWEAQRKELATIGEWLGRGQFIPSEKAAQTVWQVAFPSGRK